MGKKKILKKQKVSFTTTLTKKSKVKPTKKMENTLRLKKNARVIPYSPTEELLDENFIAQAVWECLKNNDPDGVMEVIQTYLDVVNKSKAAHKINLPRSSMYNALKGNPTVKTLAKLVNCIG